MPWLKLHCFVNLFDFNANAKNKFNNLDFSWDIGVSRVLESDWFRKSWAYLTKTNWFWLDENIFGYYIKNFHEYIWDVFAIRKQKLQELFFKIFSEKFKWQNFSKSRTSCIFYAFYNRYGPWFSNISSHIQKVEKI